MAVDLFSTRIDSHDTIEMAHRNSLLVYFHQSHRCEALHKQINYATLTPAWPSISMPSVRHQLRKLVELRVDYRTAMYCLFSFNSHPACRLTRYRAQCRWFDKRLKNADSPTARFSHSDFEVPCVKFRARRERTQVDLSRLHGDSLPSKILYTGSTCHVYLI